MTAGDSKAALTITPQPALAPSPQPRPAPTARALPPGLVAQVGQNWTPIVGQNWMPIDIPFYQRAYVWSKEEQWEPLWSDIRDKAEARSNGQPPAPHFLGAIVLEPQERRGLRGVETYHIIDGQQRLTTLQYFLVAMAMAMREHAPSAVLTLIEACLWNPNPDTMEQPEIERFKVWPT